jgi:hypothetical protein
MFLAPGGKSTLMGEGERMEPEIKRFDQADECRSFEKGEFNLARAGSMTLRPGSYQPGWGLSQHFGPRVGSALCQVEHIGFVLSGRPAASIADGTEIEMGLGRHLCHPARTRSWVVGDTDHVSLHLFGASKYASSHHKDRPAMSWNPPAGPAPGCDDARF